MISAGVDSPGQNQVPALVNDRVSPLQVPSCGPPAMVEVVEENGLVEVPPLEGDGARGEGAGVFAGAAGVVVAQQQQQQPNGPGPIGRVLVQSGLAVLAKLHRRQPPLLVPLVRKESVQDRRRDCCAGSSS
jgi:hypothetical protein